MDRDSLEWRNTLRELIKKANDHELYAIARLAAAVVRKEILDEKIDQFDDKIKTLGAGEVLERLTSKASEREIRMIARLAAAVVGRKKK